MCIQCSNRISNCFFLCAQIKETGSLELGTAKDKWLQSLRSGCLDQGTNASRIMAGKDGVTLKSVSYGARLRRSCDASLREGGSMRNPFSKHRVKKFDLSSLDWIDEIPDCPVFSPSTQEFEDPMVYLSKIAPVAAKYGNSCSLYLFPLLIIVF